MDLSAVAAAADTSHMDRHRHPRHAERGASLVEYALLVAVLALGTLAGLDALQSSASAAFREQAAEMSDPPAADVASNTPTTAAPTTAPPTTTPPTTAPPTTTRPTTTTTSTTTTTTTTTTTVPKATTATGTWGATSATRDGNRWNASATLTVTDDRGQAVRGATASVKVEYRIDGGGWQTGQPVSGATSSSGTLQVSTADLARSGKSPVTSIRYTVTTVDAAGLRWVGGSPSTTLSAP
jgi:Flp pilus assembly pilin Flp